MLTQYTIQTTQNILKYNTMYSIEHRQQCTIYGNINNVYFILLNIKKQKHKAQCSNQDNLHFSITE